MLENVTSLAEEMDPIGELSRSDVIGVTVRIPEYLVIYYITSSTFLRFYLHSTGHFSHC